MLHPVGLRPLELRQPQPVCPGVLPALPRGAPPDRAGNRRGLAGTDAVADGLQAVGEQCSFFVAPVLQARAGPMPLHVPQLVGDLGERALLHVIADVAHLEALVGLGFEVRAAVEHEADKSASGMRVQLLDIEILERVHGLVDELRQRVARENRFRHFPADTNVLEPFGNRLSLAAVEADGLLEALDIVGRQQLAPYFHELVFFDEVEVATESDGDTRGVARPDRRRLVIVLVVLAAAGLMPDDQLIGFVGYELAGLLGRQTRNIGLEAGSFKHLASAFGELSLPIGEHFREIAKLLFPYLHSFELSRCWRTPIRHFKPPLRLPKKEFQLLSCSLPLIAAKLKAAA